MSKVEKTQHAIRRSTRLPLEVPVLLSSLDPSTPFSENGNTTLVNAHGCGVIIGREIRPGTAVRMEIVSAKRHTTARVVEMVPLGGDPETWLIGIELDVQGNFWGIEYAPSDWKVEPAPGPAIPAPPVVAQPQPTAKAKAAHVQRWRLTDISEGACYLETSRPFPADTPVLLSIRTSNGETLFDGVVRVSHAETGMGVEFTSTPGLNLRAKVEDLIGSLITSREVPKIFAGRKEGKQAASLDANAHSRQNGDSPDPLLELVRGGSELSVEQFHDNLRAQRLGKRRDP